MLMYKAAAIYYPTRVYIVGVCVYQQQVNTLVQAWYEWTVHGITNLFVLFITIFLQMPWKLAGRTSPYSYSNSVPKNPPSFAELHSEVLKRGWGGGGTHPAL